MSKHKWTKVQPDYQWGQTRGGRPGDAISWWGCNECAQSFAHRYNEEPSLYHAAKAQGIDLDSECPGKPEALTLEQWKEPPLGLQ